jgi:hypothetical protein
LQSFHSPNIYLPEGEDKAKHENRNAHDPDLKDEAWRAKKDRFDGKGGVGECRGPSLDLNMHVAGILRVLDVPGGRGLIEGVSICTV